MGATFLSSPGGVISFSIMANLVMLYLHITTPHFYHKFVMAFRTTDVVTSSRGPASSSAVVDWSFLGCIDRDLPAYYLLVCHLGVRR